MPVRARDAAGTPCLLVLPSEGPSGRHEAEAAVAALRQLLADPAAAAPRAAAWRQQLLLSSSAAALLGLTANYAPHQHEQQLRKARQAGASRAVLAGPAWLAASNDSDASLPVTPSGRLDEAVLGVRSSSGFLQSGSHGGMGRSAGPLPPLALPQAISRMGRAPPVADGTAVKDGSQTHAAAHSGLELHSTGSVISLGPASPAAAAATAASDAAAQPASSPPPPPPVSDPAWDTYCCASLAAGLAACMAEAVRQVEVGCAERGRLLAQLWNSYTGGLRSVGRVMAAVTAYIIVLGIIRIGFSLGSSLVSMPAEQWGNSVGRGLVQACRAWRSVAVRGARRDCPCALHRAHPARQVRRPSSRLRPAAAGVLSATIQEQQAQAGALAAANANLSAEALQLRWENSTMSFLRTEIGRLRIVSACGVWFSRGPWPGCTQRPSCMRRDQAACERQAA